MKQLITVQATLTFISREFTEPLPTVRINTVSCEATLETTLSQPRDSPPVSSLTGIPLVKALGSCGASPDAIS